VYRANSIASEYLRFSSLFQSISKYSPQNHVLTQPESLLLRYGKKPNFTPISNKK